jgi:predicted metal-dependent peptidase
MNKQAFDRVTAARIQVLQTSPFYGLAAMRFKLVEDTNHPDMWTDGDTLGYSPTWALECSFDLLKGTIAHCAHHVALCHHLRRESRDEKLWNASTDRVVNAAMREAGFALPKGVHVTEGDGEKSAEELYGYMYARQPKNHMPSPEQGKADNKKDSDQQGDGKGQGDDQDGEDQDGGDGKGQGDGASDNSSEGFDAKDGKGKGKGKGKPGDGDSQGKGSGSQSDQPGECKDAKNGDGSSLSQSQQDQKIQEQLQDTAALAQQAKGIGDLPGSIARQIQALLYPQQDWAQQLREFMLSLSNDDYSWTRPNRRFIGQGLYLPALQTEGRMGRIVVAIDTSGSISSMKLDVFIHELNGIMEQCRPESVVIIPCDTQIGEVIEFGPDEHPIEIGHIVGQGGTSLLPPFQYVADEGLNPDCFLYFTDLGGSFPDTDPGYPVVWIDQDDYYASRQYREYWKNCIPTFGKLIGIPGENW